MEFTFEKSVVCEEKTAFVPEINDGVSFSDGSDIRAKELLEHIKSAKENGDM